MEHHKGRATETIAPGTSPAPAIPPPLNEEMLLAGRYEIRRVVGTGGYAHVYAAHDRELRREIAVKVLRSDRISDSSLTRFRREVRIACEANSPHLLRVYDLLQTDGLVCLTMELLDGESLREKMAAGPLPIEQVVEYARQILLGLDALHSLGIIHRDLKPANILTTRTGELKLGDFGLARHWEGEETRATETEGVVGTFEYVSPEQALGADLDARSDLYSFGVLLFEMLTSETPFQSTSSFGSVLARLQRRPADVRKLRKDVPAWLSGVIARLLEKEREERYSSAAEVLSDIDARRGRMSRRRMLRIGAGAAAAAVTAGLALAGLMEWTGTSELRLAADGSTGLRVVDARGRTLWRDPDLAPGVTATMARLEPGRPPRLVGIRSPGASTGMVTPQTLLILDASSGRVVDSANIASFASVFHPFSDTYSVNGVSNLDLDHDGVHEVAVTFTHHPYYPSYSVVYDPRLQEVAPLFFASGHHHVIGQLDVDDDGIDEVIFAGINNRMGWYGAVGAVKTRRPVSRAAGQNARWMSAATPDIMTTAASPEALAWYALLPSGYQLSTTKVDRERKIISAARIDGTLLELDAGGFAVGSDAGGLSSGERNTKRSSSYAALREAERISPADAERAVALIETAAESALESRDAVLLEWVERRRGVMRVRAGRFREAEQGFRNLADTATAPADVAWDAARAFHLAGELEEAIYWYRRGISNSSTTQGRLPYEFAEGLTFALGEGGRWSEALEDLRRFRGPAGADEHLDAYAAWIAWRSGDGTMESLECVNIDLCRYWRLEHRLGASGLPELTGLIDRDLETTSGETTPMLLSLKAAALDRAGRSEEGLQVARTAFQQGVIASREHTAVRAHLDLITERYVEIARKAGAADELSAAHALLAERRAARVRRSR
jgi:tRNA A-37 threonylcarbamoyl transferase component Bud32